MVYNHLKNRSAASAFGVFIPAQRSRMPMRQHLLHNQFGVDSRKITEITFDIDHEIDYCE
jgi:hypothetical protein